MDQNKLEIIYKICSYFKILKNYLVDSISDQIHRYLYRDITRTSVSVAFSVIVHSLAVFFFIGIIQINEPEELPIREINYVDMNDLVFQKEEIATKNKKQKSGKKTVPQKLKPTKKVEPNLATSKQAIELNSKDRFQFNASRKQAPINIKRYASIVGSSSHSNSNDILKVSTAYSSKPNKRRGKSRSINLKNNKRIMLVNTVNNPVRFNKKKLPQPKINLKKRTTINSELNRSISPESSRFQGKPDNKSKSFESLNQAKTFIAGPLGLRQILRKKIPSFPLWAKKRGIGATISLRFTVMESGKVKENIIIERTSGSREWDRLVIESLKDWEFRPLDKIDKRFDQTGVITFQFVI